MQTTGRIAIVLALVIVVAVAVITKRRASPPPPPPTPVSAQQSETPVPRLLCLGSGICIPCKMMEPVREELAREYQGRLKVNFIDVRETPGIGQAHGIRVIPTSIFYDAAGKELARHEGFISKADILAKFKASGVELSSTAK